LIFFFSSYIKIPSINDAISGQVRDVRLLLPFVTTLEDLSQAWEILTEVFVEMNILDNLPRIGIMVEVPSVALSIKRFLPKIDFVCLGNKPLGV
jgi:phosphoenolpyruvate-protein kinase (PTS system EI component)